MHPFLRTCPIAVVAALALAPAETAAQASGSCG
jgi:hypothetical protein